MKIKLINGFTKQSVKDAILRYVPQEGCIIEETQTCVYQAFDEDDCEMRCAVGAFMPDGHDALQAIGSASEIMYEHPSLKEHMPMERHDLMEMQTKHDNAASSNVYVNVVDELFEWIDENFEDCD